MSSDRVPNAADKKERATQEVNVQIRSQNDIPELEYDQSTTAVTPDDRTSVHNDSQDLQHQQLRFYDQSVMPSSATNFQASNLTNANPYINQHIHDPPRAVTPTARPRLPPLGQLSSPVDPAAAAALAVASPNAATRSSDLLNTFHAQRYQIDMFSYGTYLGRINLPMALHHHVPHILAQGNQMPILGHLVLPSPPITTSHIPTSPISHTTTDQSKKRKADLEEAPDRKVKLHSQSPESSARTDRKSKKPKRDWTKATPRPTGNTKLETDTCLTCIQYNKKWSGTTFTNGKCEPCSGHGDKRTSKRKCYHQDLANGIKTYDDARAKDPSSYRLPQNTKKGRAQRAASITTPSMDDFCDDELSPCDDTSTVFKAEEDQDPNLDPRLFEDADDDDDFND